MNDEIEKGVTAIVEKCLKGYDGGRISAAEYIAKAVISAHFEETGFAIVPVEPTPKMLIKSGEMEGFDIDIVGIENADRVHVKWWKTMIAAAQNGE